MKILCLNTTVLSTNNDNRIEKSKNNDPTISNLPLPIKVKHAPKKVKKSIIPVRIEELTKVKAAKTEKAIETEEKPKKRGRPCKKKRDAKEKAGEFEVLNDTSGQDENALDAKVKKQRKKLVKLQWLPGA